MRPSLHIVGRLLLGVGLCGSPAVVAGQQTTCRCAEEAPWAATVTAGLARRAQGGQLGSDFGVAIGLSRRLGASSRLGLDLGYLRLGSRDDTGPTATFPPELLPATYYSHASQGMYHLGLLLEQRLFRGPPNPSFLLGVGYYGLRARYHYILRENASQGIVTESNEAGTYWGPGISVGLGLSFPGMTGSLVPRIVARGHVALVRSVDDVSEVDAISVGLGLSF